MAWEIVIFPRWNDLLLAALVAPIRRGKGEKRFFRGGPRMRRSSFRKE